MTAAFNRAEAREALLPDAEWAGIRCVAPTLGGCSCLQLHWPVSPSTAGSPAGRNVSPLRESYARTRSRKQHYRPYRSRTKRGQGRTKRQSSRTRPRLERLRRRRSRQPPMPMAERPLSRASVATHSWFRGGVDHLPLRLPVQTDERIVSRPQREDHASSVALSLGRRPTSLHGRTSSKSIPPREP